MMGQVSWIEYIAAGLFFLALIHTFSIKFFMRLAQRDTMHAGVWMMLGEVEIVFGFWSFVLLGVMAAVCGYKSAVDYVDSRNFVEPVFVFVILVIAGTRPILQASRLLLEVLNKLILFFPEALTYYFLTLTVVPLLGSFITEPAAMTLAAIILRDKYFSKNIPETMKYLTIAILFVNVSIGGALTSFAAPPVLMVASKWGWGQDFMLLTFGWKSALAVGINALIATWLFRRVLLRMAEEENSAARPSVWVRLARFLRKGREENKTEAPVERAPLTMKIARFLRRDNYENKVETPAPAASQIPLCAKLIRFLQKGRDERKAKAEEMAATGHVPLWVMAVHLAVLAGVVLFSHHPFVFMGLFLFFLGFTEAYHQYQDPLMLKEGLLVGFFLAGLVVLGGMQKWWLAPVLSQLNSTMLFVGAISLTSITDNAALTYLGSLVEGLSDASKYALVAGAITGGGLTVIANAPNPISFSLLKNTFEHQSINPLMLFLYALLPTCIAGCAFLLL